METNTSSPDAVELRRRICLSLSILNWREDDPARAVELSRLALYGASLDDLVALEPAPPRPAGAR